MVHFLTIVVWLSMFYHLAATVDEHQRWLKEDHQLLCRLARDAVAENEVSPMAAVDLQAFIVQRCEGVR